MPMPVIKSAKKKLHQDRKKQQKNNLVKTLFQDLVKKAKKSPSEKTILAAVKATDKAAKKNLIHKNKAARVKSALAKLLSPKGKDQHSTKTARITKKSPQKFTSQQ